MDEQMWRPEPPEQFRTRPETDMQEAGTPVWFSEDFRPGRPGPADETAARIFTDGAGPVILP